MEILLPQFMAVVMAIFLSPALPEEMIKVGDPCEQAMAVAHEQGLTLVDKEYVPIGRPLSEFAQLEAPVARTLGVLSLSYGQTNFARVANAALPDRANAGFLLCSLAAMGEDPTPKE